MTTYTVKILIKNDLGEHSTITESGLSSIIMASKKVNYYSSIYDILDVNIEKVID